MTRRLLDWIFTPLSVGAFVGSLLIGHGVLTVGLMLGEWTKKPITDIFNYIIFSSLKLSGVRFIVSDQTWSGIKQLPINRPIIIVSNHQSMIDIPFIGWTFRRHRPKFVSKVELSKGAPYVSLNLRNGAGVLIDRRNPKQAVKALENYGQMIEKMNYSICIFPEGTRARDGKLKPFKSSGIKSLLKVMPRALVVPIAIDRSWELVRYKMLPVPFGIKVTLTVLPPIEPSGKDPMVLTKSAETEIRALLQI